MTGLPSIEDFAANTGNSLRRVIKGALLRLAPEFRTAKVRRDLLLKQNNLCPICGETLVDGGRETQVDHKWTTDEAANAVFDESMDLIRAYNKLWATENLRAVHAACNFRRNKKEAVSGDTMNLPLRSEAPMHEPGDYIKVEFAGESGMAGEWMWVRVLRCDDANQLVYGTLDNEPVSDYDGKVELGSELAVS